MKSNVIRKLLPVMLMITLTAGIAPVSYAAADRGRGRRASAGFRK